MFFDDRSMVDAVGERIYNDFVKHKASGVHPRVAVTQKDVEEIKKFVATDEVMAEVYRQEKEIADGYFNIPPREYIKVTYRLLASSQEVLERVQRLCIMYWITEDERYAERAYAEVENICTVWPDWNSYHGLDTAEAMAACVTCYDWIYDYLCEERRSFIENTVMERGFKEFLDDYFGFKRERSDPRKVGERRISWLDYNNNWCFICNGSILMACLAFMDSDNVPKSLLKLLSGFAFTDIERTFKEHIPEDGAYPEGTMYWYYYALYLTKTISTLDNCLGTNYGLTERKGFDISPYFVFNMSGVMPFNFSDSGVKYGMHQHILWYVNYFKDKRLFKLYQELNEHSIPKRMLQKLLYYRPIDTENCDFDFQLDTYYPSIETAIMRNCFTDIKNLTFVGLHAGDNKATHSHLDCGSFVLDMLGERFALDLGPDDYNIPGEFFRYRYSAEGHNTYVINRTDVYTQNEKAATEIIKFETGKDGAFAIADITPAYDMYLKKLHRGIKLFDNRTRVLIQDELEADEEFDAWWQMHTEADIEISEDKKRAVLTINDKSITAKILSPAGVGFEVLAPKPFPETPVFAGQNPNEGIKKLCIHFEKIKSVVAAVEFSAEEAADSEIVDLKDWRIENGIS